MGRTKMDKKMDGEMDEKIDEDCRDSTCYIFTRLQVSIYHTLPHGKNNEFYILCTVITSHKVSTFDWKARTK